jgi:hypothetical protein
MKKMYSLIREIVLTLRALLKSYFIRIDRVRNDGMKKRGGLAPTPVVIVFALPAPD